MGVSLVLIFVTKVLFVFFKNPIVDVGVVLTTSCWATFNLHNCSFKRFNKLATLALSSGLIVISINGVVVLKKSVFKSFLKIVEARLGSSKFYFLLVILNYLYTRNLLE